MRYNDRELACLADRTQPTIEGVLHHMRPQQNDWSDWYQQPSFKERYFKLVANLLFYYRINESEPVGVLVLENSHIAYERPHKGIPFAFSITFKPNDEAKHIFSCRCDEDVLKWVSALRTHSYDYWRSQFIILQTKISMKTGQDPVLDYMKNKTDDAKTNGVISQVKVTKKTTRKSTFCSHVQTSFFEDTCIESSAKRTQVNDEDLIKL